MCNWKSIEQFCLQNKTAAACGKHDIDCSQCRWSLTVDMSVIFHINDILNDSAELHAYLPLQYINVFLSREWASLYLDFFIFRHQNKPFCIGIGMK